MSKFLDDLFDDLEKPENENTNEVEATNEVEEIEQVEDETETDEGVTEEVAEDKEAEGAPEVTDAEDDDETGFTPAERKAYGLMKATLAERDKRQSAETARKEAEAELARVRNELADMHRRQNEAAAQNLPDAYEDPQGYIAAREAQFQQELTRQSLGYSISRAVDKYGEADTEAAAQWFERQIAANPSFDLRGNMLQQPDPMEYVLLSYKQANEKSAPAVDVSSIIAELQKAGYNISKADTPTGAASAAPITTAAATTAATPSAPAAPKRSKLAGASSANTASTGNASMMDAVMRR